MTIINIGTADLLTSAFPVPIGDISVNSQSAYLIQGNFTSSNFGLIYSRIVITLEANSDTENPYLIPFREQPDITQKTFTFYLPLSKMLDNSSTLRFYAERISNIRQTSDQTADLQLTLFYDDANTGKTWLS